MELELFQELALLQTLDLASGIVFIINAYDGTSETLWQDIGIPHKLEPTNALIIYFGVGVIFYRERGKVLAPTSFAMVSKKTEEECSQKLNERMHALIGTREED